MIRHLVLLFACLLVSRPAWAQFEELVQRVPQKANSLFLVNVDKILASPAAIAGNWKAKHEQAHASGVTILPPDASHAVLAAEFDLEHMLTIWETAVMQLHDAPSLSSVAKMTKGKIEAIEKQFAVALPGDAYLVQFGPKQVAAMSPANRQAVSRWIRDAKGRTSHDLSPYLREAFSFANDLGTPVILALDLEDVASPDQIRVGLHTSERVQQMKSLNIEQAANFLSTIRGITLGITFGDKPFGKIKVDFRDNVPFPPESAKQLLIGALTRRGAMLDEIEAWTPKVNGKQFTIEGNLGKSGMRRVFSLFDRPPSLPKESDTVKPRPPKPEESVVVVASKAYFKGVDDLLDDLRAKPGQNPQHTIGQVGVWYETYARKIERLNVQDVDVELIDYGTRTSESLRSASTAIKSGAARKTTRKANIQPQYDYYTYGATYGYSYRWNAFGGGYMPTGVSGTVAVEDKNAYWAEVSRIRNEERVSSLAEARQIIDGVDRDTAAIRKKMSVKYKTEF